MPRLPDPEPVDDQLVRLLHGRAGRLTTVELESGKRCRVMNIAWGYDAGDKYAHVTSNCSPFIEGFDLHSFFTSEIVSVEDEVSRTVLWRRIV